ncbi:MAG: choice-of-anchor B family protein [Candidatus Zixiibacteriota bacterium]
MRRFTLLTAVVWLIAGYTMVGAVPIDYVPANAADNLTPLQSDQTAGSHSTMAAMAGDSTFFMCLVGSTRPDSAFGGTECWGWEAPDGKEYAIMGVNGGVAFINAATLQTVDIVPGPTAGCGSIRWREMKTYQHYCYVASECSGTNQGMMIIDMQYLPDSVHYVGSFSTASDVTCHCMSIDTAKGYAYLVKSNYSGFRIVSLANPVSPVEVGFVNTVYLHDMTARNDTVWAAEGTQGSFSVWNCANKTSPTLLARVHIPSSGFVHNVWPTLDGKYVGTTEETANKTVKFWNVQNLANIQLVGQYLGPSHLAHNVHMQSGKAFLSHYESGVSVVDMADPSNPVELARYDTYTTGESPNFNGAWGVFPYTRSGKIYASNLDGRCFVLQTNTALIRDTIKGQASFALPGTKVSVDVSINNDVPLNQIIIPFSWAGSYNLNFDSATTTGLRTSYFLDQALVAINPLGYQGAFKMATVSQPDLPAGSGPVLRLHFTVPMGASGPTNKISFTPYTTGSTYTPLITSQCYSTIPDTVSGSVTLGTGSCCVGLHGNVNGSVGETVDLADLSLLVAFLTGGSSSGIICTDEANVNGLGTVDLADLSALVSYLTGGGYVLPPCS